MLGYTFGSYEEDQVMFSGKATTVLWRGKVVAEYTYLGKLGAVLFCLRHPFGLFLKGKAS